MKWVIVSRLVVVVSIIWEMVIFGGAFRGNIGSSFRFDVAQFLLMSTPVVVVIGLMWIFGVFRLKREP